MNKGREFSEARSMLPFLTDYHDACIPYVPHVHIQFSYGFQQTHSTRGTPTKPSHHLHQQKQRPNTHPGPKNDAKKMLTRVGFEPTQISLLAPEASALDRSAILPGCTWYLYD